MKAKSVYEAVELVAKAQDFVKVQDAELSEDQQRQLMTSMRAKNFLDGFFKKFGATFQCSTRKDIEESFKAAKLTKPDSQLFKLFIESQYAKNYQHFANFVVKEQEKQPSEEKKVEDSGQ